jgi:hypothetical protein
MPGFNLCSKQQKLLYEALVPSSIDFLANIQRQFSGETIFSTTCSRKIYSYVEKDL